MWQSVISVRGEGELRHHLLDMGLTPGTEVSLRATAHYGRSGTACAARI